MAVSLVIVCHNLRQQFNWEQPKKYLINWILLILILVFQLVWWKTWLENFLEPIQMIFDFELLIFKTDNFAKPFHESRVAKMIV